MADTFTLEVVTPTRLVVRETVSEAQIPVRGGYIGVLPGHTPLLAEMGIGELSYHAGGRVFSCTAIGGFVEVLGDRVIVLADRAERAEEIDVPRAQAALERAQRRLATPNGATERNAGFSRERQSPDWRVKSQTQTPIGRLAFPGHTSAALRGSVWS